MTPIEIYAMLQRKINEGGYGSPLVASLAENMTDQNRVYVYTGSETGMETGHWYYYDGEDWADGGVYNSIAVQTDKNLTQENKAADGKATGDAIAANTTLINQNAGEITQLKSEFTDLGLSVEEGVLCIEFGEDEELEG